MDHGNTKTPADVVIEIGRLYKTGMGAKRIAERMGHPYESVRVDAI